MKDRTSRQLTTLAVILSAASMFGVGYLDRHAEHKPIAISDLGVTSSGLTERGHAIDWQPNWEWWLDWLMRRTACRPLPTDFHAEVWMKSAIECFRANGTPSPKSDPERFELIDGLTAIRGLVADAPDELDTNIVGEFGRVIDQMLTDLEVTQ